MGYSIQSQAACLLKQYKVQTQDISTTCKLKINKHIIALKYHQYIQFIAGLIIIVRRMPGIQVILGTI